jgi:hypothetical protein
LSNDGEPSSSGLGLQSTALNVDLYLGRRSKPVISMLVTLEKSPVAFRREGEALAASSTLFLKRLPPGARAAKIVVHLESPARSRVISAAGPFLA